MTSKNCITWWPASSFWIYSLSANATANLLRLIFTRTGNNSSVRNGLRPIVIRDRFSRICSSFLKCSLLIYKSFSFKTCWIEKMPQQIDCTQSDLFRLMLHFVEDEINFLVSRFATGHLETSKHFISYFYCNHIGLSVFS